MLEEHSSRATVDWDGDVEIIALGAEILDALGAGTLSVITPTLVADLSWGSGRTQTTLGAVMAVQGIGASLSGSFGGTLISWIGWRAAFLGLALPPVMAIVGAIYLLRLVRPTAPATTAGGWRT